MLPRAVLVVGLLAPLLMLLGALGTRLGAWDFETGLQFVFTAAFVAPAVLLAGVAVLVFALRTGRPRQALPIGAGLAGSVLALAVLGWQYHLAVSAPFIHHISTDRDDPPAFHQVDLRGEEANPLDYNRNIAHLQAVHYPHLNTIRSSLDPDESFGRAAMVAEDLGWRIVYEAPDGRGLQAVATTFWFGFADDVVIRIRPQEDGALVDLRSVSRVGVNDLGANAARIERFIERFGAH